MCAPFLSSTHILNAFYIWLKPEVLNIEVVPSPALTSHPAGLSLRPQAVITRAPSNQQCGPSAWSSLARTPSCCKTKRKHTVLDFIYCLLFFMTCKVLLFICLLCEMENYRGVFFLKSHTHKKGHKRHKPQTVLYTVGVPFSRGIKRRYIRNALSHLFWTQ